MFFSSSSDVVEMSCALNTLKLFSLIVAIIFCLVPAVTSKNPPKWEPVYQVKGTLRIPYAGKIRKNLNSIMMKRVRSLEIQKPCTDSN